ncbi:carbohydrate ABC transporter substrate-binding protein [Paenibacillus psychroresistens]|uniref:Carbohydrate ABC transporter substrate-binding protein n=1 Tax=Paenibacillus psychroresistens TaxID=1778678 RepID=A0A6B8RRI4_9BACL|nr:ABC transporter substrate-binding protein [Paenibacillus psychroresistens]QGQ98322.1 carbohydrate ABC transporter substrate-binding protein [Paenibacillus psychroresistens]
MKTSFKSITLITLLSISLLSLSACGSSSNNEQASSAPQATVAEKAATEAPATEAPATATPEPKKDPVTLSFAMSGDVPLTGVEEIFKNFEAKTGNKVEILGLPDYANVIKARLATKDYPDVFWYYPGTGDFSVFKPDENFADLSNEAYVSDITDSQKNFQTLDGKLYGMPWGASTTMSIYYNKEVFTKLSLAPPKNYADFLAICETIKAAGITPIQTAVKDGWPEQVYFLASWETFVDPAIGKEGIDKLNKNELKIKDIPQVKDIFTRELELKTKGYFPKNLLSTTYDMQAEAVMTGKAAMMIEGDWVLADVQKKFGDAGLDKLGAFPIPSDTDTGTVVLYPPGQVIVAKNNKNADVAKELLAFMSTPESLAIWYGKNPGMPVFKSAMETAKLSAPQKDMLNYQNTSKSEINVQFRLLPTFTDFDKISQQFIISGNVDEAVNMLDKNYQRSGKDKKLAGF